MLQNKRSPTPNLLELVTWSVSSESKRGVEQHRSREEAILSHSWRASEDNPGSSSQFASKSVRALDKVTPLFFLFVPGHNQKWNAAQNIIL